MSSLVDYLKRSGKYRNPRLTLAQAERRLMAAGRGMDESVVKAKKDDLSKVVSLGNKLSASMSRSEAFKTAWKIERNGLEVSVKGTSFLNRQNALRKLAQYDVKDIHTVLVPEYDNPYDANAISVQVMVNGAKDIYRLGYVPKEETNIAKAFIGKIPELKIISGDCYGARIRLTA